VATVGDGVTAVYVDGGLRAVLSGVVLAGAATPVGKSAHAVWYSINFPCAVAVKVRLNRDLCVMILSIWSWSLLQFTLVLTATKERKDRSASDLARTRTFLLQEHYFRYWFTGGRVEHVANLPRKEEKNDPLLIRVS